MSPLHLEAGRTACTGPRKQKAGLRNSTRISFWGNPEICQWDVWDATSTLWSFCVNTSLNKKHKVLLKAKKKIDFNIYGVRPQGRDPEALLCIQMCFLLISSLRGQTFFCLSDCGYVKCFKPMSHNEHHWEHWLCTADGCRTWAPWEIQGMVLSCVFMTSAFSCHWKTQYITLTLRVLSLHQHNTPAEVLPSWGAQFGSGISLHVHTVAVFTCKEG